MKFILTLLLMGIIHCSYSQNKNDQILREGKAAYNQDEHDKSILLLSQIKSKGKPKEIADYWIIMNYNQLAKKEVYPSYALISKVRTLSDIFRQRHPKSGHIFEVRQIASNMNTYPKTSQAYELWRQEEERRILKEKQEGLLNEIKLAYQNGNYPVTDKAIQYARNDGYNSAYVQYYDFLNKYHQSKQVPFQNYKEVEDLSKLASNVINTSDSILSALERSEISKIYSSLPKSLEEFEKMEAARLLEKRRLEMLQKFNELEKAYNLFDYTTVIDASNDFAESSTEREKVGYYQGISHYKLLVNKTTYTFNDISKVMSALQGYLSKYPRQNLSHTNDINAALVDLNNRYPKTELAYNAILKKKERESQAIIRKANRKMFTSIGYEYGELAPYGLRFETGGNTVGFFTTLRYGMKSNSELIEHYSKTGASQPNKSEIIVGPNFKLTKWLFINVGGGYGIYSHLFRNDYANVSGVDKTGYIAGYGGITLRAGSVINLIGGASFIDVDKQISNGKFINPEFTVGITFNIK